MLLLRCDLSYFLYNLNFSLESPFNYLCIVGQPVVSVQFAVVNYLKLFITDFLEFLKTTCN